MTVSECKTLLERYAKNRESFNEQNEKIRQPVSREDWFGLIRTRSEVTRHIYAENNGILSELEACLKEPLTGEMADMLYDAIMELYLSGVDDFHLMKVVSDALIAFYEDADNLDRLFPMYRLQAFEIMMLNGLAIDDEAREDILTIYEKLLSYTGRYSEINDEESRSCIFNAYGNIVTPLSFKAPKFRALATQAYQKARALWESSTVQAMDRNNELILSLLGQMNEDYLYTALEYLDDLNDEERNIIIAIAENKSVEGCPDDIISFRERAGMISGMLCGKISTTEALDFLTDHISRAVPEIDYQAEDRDAEYAKLSNYYDAADIMLKIMAHSRLSVEEEAAYADQILPGLFRVFETIPYDFYTSSVNYISAEWYQGAVYFLNNFDEKYEFLEKTIIMRQPYTYIHSLMVSKIARLIGSEIINVRPGLFAGVRNYETAEKVITWKRELLNYIERCGLLHDIGKCLIVDVVNEQSRRLDDSEFKIIKKHPSAGVKYLEGDPDFSSYIDVIEGHHKFYNGKGGYPESFDNTASPVRFIIDLITIADCMDAALDRLGRNYAHGKTFDDLFKELEADAGIRYNPDILEIIAASPALKEKLEYLTGDGRTEVYYQAYETIYKKGT